MVYLIRHVRVTGNWEKMEAAARGLAEYWEKQPECTSVEAWSNIAGPQDAYRFVASFDSLADEEKFALRLWNDPGYEKVMIPFMEVFALDDDELVRVME